MRLLTFFLISRSKMEKTAKKVIFCALLHEFKLSKVKNLFLIVIYVDIHQGQFHTIFEDCIHFCGSIIQKRAKGYFHSILLYKPILELVTNLYLLCLLIDAHLGLILAKFQVIATIFEREIKKNCQKSKFLQYFTV